MGGEKKHKREGKRAQDASPGSREVSGSLNTLHRRGGTPIENGGRKVDVDWKFRNGVNLCSGKHLKKGCVRCGMGHGDNATCLQNPHAVKCYRFQQGL